VRRDAQVVVVGGGPAGSSLALRLAAAGVSVLLLDERAFPRSKPCGDCLSPGARPLLAELGLDGALAREGAAALAGWRLRTPAGRWFEGRFGTGPAGEPLTAPALPRRELDALLLERAADAGARVREGVRVVDLVRERGRVTGVLARDRTGRESRLRADLVAGADGLRSTVARRLGGVRTGPRSRLALVARYADVRPGSVRPGDGTVLGRMRVSGEGCLGMAPVGGGRWNVTVVVPRGEAGAIAADRDGFLAARLAGYGAVADLAGARRLGPIEVTGPFEVSPRRVTAPGALLVGDAAGYFDPFTGQGIHGALAGARLAAACCLEALGAGAGEAAAGEAAALRRYERALAGRIGPSRRVQRVLDLVLGRPALLEPAARLLAARPGLADLLVRVTGDLEPAGALLDPRRLAAALTGRGRVPPPTEEACTPTTRSWSRPRWTPASRWRPTSRPGPASSGTTGA